MRSISRDSGSDAQRKIDHQFCRFAPARNDGGENCHVLNLEEPALFNETVERLIALVEANRRGKRDPRSVLAG
jgi:hypothetical protein